MESVKRFITQRLKLKVNEAQSAVARPQERTFLGFTFTTGPEVKRAIAPKALAWFKGRIREITRRAKSVSIETCRWTAERGFAPLGGIPAKRIPGLTGRCMVFRGDGLIPKRSRFLNAATFPVPYRRPS